MNDILDAAAQRSAKALKSVSQNAFVARARGQVGIARAVAETVWERAEPRVPARVQGAAATFAKVVPGMAGRGVHPAAHGVLATPESVETLPGDDEKCTCRGEGARWCGATKRDVLHDLMANGSQLSRDQAEHIWVSAQTARAAAEA
ncbi:hypothetical protein [Frondihabitans cladoniiphilus]|uniref:Lsr2 protein n=1 Tax=Frondihabitans cladoniiphilus TaxID=715785 RepID=A0ABP8VUF6_9MICO